MYRAAAAEEPGEGKSQVRMVARGFLTWFSGETLEIF